MRITLSEAVNFADLEPRWRDLETRALGSFFQGWSWTGCLARERFPDPILAEATEDGRTIALALFNRVRRRFRRSTLHLGETGVESIDNLAIEHNGVLVEAGRDPAVASSCLAAVVKGQLGWAGAVVVSGIDVRGLAALRAVAPRVHVTISRQAPFLNLRPFWRPPGPPLSGEQHTFLDGRSANTRQQIRRSDRAYAAEGPLGLRRAETVCEAIGFLEEMEVLHQASWTARGLPGSFADPFFGRFHRALIERAMPRDEVDLLRVTAGDALIGVLYNFRYRGRSLAYQSGFNYAAAGRHQKPGMTCHHHAIQFAAACGLEFYDFLAGADRYKRSLADQEEALFWVEAGNFLSPRLVGLGLWRVGGRWRRPGTERS
jgi:CelD/BcsL family acetyltransferase involved in cellulose biosynthesis